jgi:hypothetical protein
MLVRYSRVLCCAMCICVSAAAPGPARRGLCQQRQASQEVIAHSCCCRAVDTAARNSGEICDTSSSNTCWLASDVNCCCVLRLMAPATQLDYSEGSAADGLTLPLLFDILAPALISVILPIRLYRSCVTPPRRRQACNCSMYTAAAAACALHVQCPAPRCKGVGCSCCRACCFDAGMP